MKKLLAILGIVSCIPHSTKSQIVSENFDNERRKILRNGMTVLTGYSVANIASGLILQNNTTGSEKYFHQMNALWNTVTLGIIAIGHFTNKDKGVLPANEQLKKQKQTEKLFLINTGLDVLYTGAGIALMEKAKTTNKNPDKLKGYGQSLVLQGAFLFAFDGIMYALHRRHGKQIRKPGMVKFGETDGGVGLVVRLR